MTRILLLANTALSLHRLRMESRRSGVPFVYECAPNPGEFTRLIAQRPAMVLGALDEEAGMPVSQVAERCAQTRVPLFLIGGDTQQERSLLASLAIAPCSSCRRSRLPWLPLLLEREVRSRAEWGAPHLAAYHQDAANAATELEQAADRMRTLQKLAILGQLIGSIVHEINNPLESIMNINFLLSIDSRLPEDLREHVALAEQELKRVTQISKQTLSYCRETEAPVRTELSSLVDEVLLLFARKLRDKHIEVVRRYESREPVLVFPGEMRQVYANLLANAIEATAPGGRIVVRMRHARHPVSGVEGVRVLVADSGSGIPAEVRDSLGTPFFTTKGQRGTGLGLWVSRAIVERYGGQIQLRSSTADSRHGTTFGIFLPLNLSPHIVSPGSAGHKLQLFREGALNSTGLQLRASRS